MRLIHGYVFWYIWSISVFFLTNKYLAYVFKPQFYKILYPINLVPLLINNESMIIWSKYILNRYFSIKEGRT